ncbi:oligopeptide/dipeptide ABC transporter ATP-binding protein [Micromonospora parva]|uniref:oligopeptide/dipeptide ABC transporter ATP-binding protein n=1 Tax=Micromonospora parva TaxID=1464048 RepID=UPI00366F084F
MGLLHSRPTTKSFAWLTFCPEGRHPDLRKEFGIAFVFIAHDLGVVRHFCDRVAVMYLGRVAKIADRDALYGTPQHPYTQALLSAVPDLGTVRGAAPKPRIRLAGDVPGPMDPPTGCRFRSRCWKAEEVCATTTPPLVQVGTGHTAACHFAGSLDDEPAAAPVA